MTSRTATRARRAPAPPPPKRPPVVPLAAGALVLALVIGVAIAALGGGKGDVGRDDLVYGSVDATGAALPLFDATAAVDAAVGLPAPVLDGEALDGSPTTVGPGEPTIVAFLAHWCPHCQAELPRLVAAGGAGELDGIRLVAVLTGTNPDAPNFPPGAWLEREGWTGDVVVDNQANLAAGAYGVEGFPFLVVLGADGTVLARTSGELPPGQLQAMAQLARG